MLLLLLLLLLFWYNILEGSARACGLKWVKHGSVERM
jgi:hypothetical protein